MNSDEIVKLLELAPTDVRNKIGLTSENQAEFAADVDACNPHARAEIAALALFYACRSIVNARKAAPLMANTRVDASVIHALIGLVSVEEFPRTQGLLGEIGRAAASKRAKAAVKVRHQKQGGRTQAVAKGKEKVVAAWKDGKYKTKQLCAEKEHEAAGISYDTAIKALRNQ